MSTQPDLDDVLKARELRSGFLAYTREAFALLPVMDQPRVLDVGCGSGDVTMVLARLSDGEVFGIDTNEKAIIALRRRVEEAGMGHRVQGVRASLLETGFADESFDVLWEEGVLQ